MKNVNHFDFLLFTLGFHYVIKYDLGTTDSYGTLFFNLKGAFGNTHPIAVNE